MLLTTKYILAHLFVGERTKKKCYEFLKQIKDSCYEQIKAIYEKEKHRKVGNRNLIEFTCDKFANYESAFMKLFGRVCKLTFGVPIACKKYNLEYNNNPIERYNGGLKERIKIFCGGFRSFKRAKYFMDLRRMLYNFVNLHQQLEGKTPTEMAEIILPLERNKLLNLIKFVRDNYIILS